MDKKLPNLPGSTPEDFKRNDYNSFFKKTVRRFWEAAEIENNKLEEPKKCDHYFIYTKDGVECRKCHMGLIGFLNIKAGKLYYRDQKILD